MIDVDLPSLQSIQLGYYALEGRNDSLCSLEMQGMNKVMGMTECRSSKSSTCNKW